MFVRNRRCSQSEERYFQDLPIHREKPDWISGQEDFGTTGGKRHFLILECSITLPPATCIPQLPLFTNNMRTRNADNMVPGFEKLNMGVLHHRFFLQLVVLAGKARCFLSGWLA